MVLTRKVTINKNIFREYDIRGIYPGQIDEKSAEAISAAFALQYKLKTVALARDRRPESIKIYDDVRRGLLRAGCHVYEMGQESTPGVFFAVGIKKLDGGIMVTASHNPNGYTGLKLINEKGIAIGAKNGSLKILALAEKILNKKIVLKKNGKKFELQVFKEYYDFVFSIVDFKKIKKLDVVLDVSGGSAAKMVDYFFVRLSGKNIKMNFKKDKFKDHGLNPMLPENRITIEKEVCRSKSDLGLIWDGDGDRIVFIDEQGKFIEPYYINSLLAEIFLKKIERKKKKIVIDGRLKLAITEAIENNGGMAVISRSGYANLVMAMKKNNALFGCENSGHYLFNLKLATENNFIVGDGILPVMMIMEYLSENSISLSEALADYKNRYKISGEVNLKNVDYQDLINILKRKYKNNPIDHRDGLSITEKDWFFNVRPSNTEPLVRINVEAKTKKIIQTIISQIKEAAA